MDIDEERAAPFVQPVVDAVRRLGLEVDEPKVLGARANVVLHLAPSPVVARVATLTAEMRGTSADYLRRERDITAALVERGVNTAGPTDLVEPGPHLAGESSFLLLEYVDLEPVNLESEQHAEAVGRAFAELSSTLAELPSEIVGDAGVGDAGHPWAEIDVAFRIVESTTEPAALDRIARVLAHLCETEPDDPWQLVHGDAHRNNVAFADGEVMWFDFEDANLRPAAWDLATLRRSWRAAGDLACRLLDVDPESPSMQWHFELREIYALLWTGVYAQRFEEHREPLAERLELWLERH